jgi:hypothetical protein
MSTKIQGGSNTAGLANVDADYNLQVNLPKDALKAGWAIMGAEIDDGLVSGFRNIRSAEITADYRFRTGIDTTCFNETLLGTVLNSNIWTAPVTTMTAVLSGGFMSLNAGSSLAINAVARLTTYRSFPIYKSYSTYYEQEVQFTSFPVIGNICEWGAFISTGTATPTDGYFFRINASGELRCVINNNGTETQSAAIDFSTYVDVNNSRSFLIQANTKQVLFWIDNICVATMFTPAGQGTTSSSMNLPLSYRNYNLAATSTAQIMKIGMCNVTLSDQEMAKPWAHTISGMGGNCDQTQTGSATHGSTALYTNNLAAGAGAAMTNTTAALGVGLGGQFTALPTLAVATDGIVCSYQVPLGTSTLPGKTLYVTGVKIATAVTTVLAGNATPVIYAMSLAFGHTNVSLATTESATAKSPRRKPIGFLTFPAAAALGTVGQELNVTFDTPTVIQSGEFFQVVAKNLGAVTTTGAICFLVDITGYFE